MKLNILDGGVTDAFTYNLFLGTGVWTAGLTFDFSVLTPGYQLSTTYGGGAGYVYNAATNSLSVQLQAVPEPGTWALLGLAGVVIVAARRKFSSQT